MDFLKKLLDVLAGVFGGGSKVDQPTPKPPEPTKPVEVTPEELTPLDPQVVVDELGPGVVPIAELGDITVAAMWHDWFKSDNGRMNEFTDGTDKATPARKYRILYETDPKRKEDLPPGAILRLAAEGCVKPQDIKPVPLNEFAYHIVILDEKGKTVLDHQVIKQAEQDTGRYFKSVPNRWRVTNGWEVQLKMVPQVGPASMPDKRVRIYMTYKDLTSKVLEVGWRHFTPPVGKK